MTNHLNKLPIRIRDKYEHLPEELRVEVARQFARHLRACKKCGFQADPMFLIEAISEVDSGRFNADALDFAVEGFGVEIS